VRWPQGHLRHAKARRAALVRLQGSVYALPAAASSDKQPGHRCAPHKYLRARTHITVQTLEIAPGAGAREPAARMSQLPARGAVAGEFEKLSSQTAKGHARRGTRLGGRALRCTRCTAGPRSALAVANRPRSARPAPPHNRGLALTAPPARAPTHARPRHQAGPKARQGSGPGGREARPARPRRGVVPQLSEPGAAAPPRSMRQGSGGSGGGRAGGSWERAGMGPPRPRGEAKRSLQRPAHGASQRPARRQPRRAPPPAGHPLPQKPWHPMNFRNQVRGAAPPGGGRRSTRTPSGGAAWQPLLCSPRASSPPTGPPHPPHPTPHPGQEI
jgi:hypothetical protein